jgi:hypothetical protein
MGSIYFSLVLILCIPVYLGIKGDLFYHTDFFWRSFYVQLGVLNFFITCPILRKIKCNEFVCNKFVLVLVQIDLIKFENGRLWQKTRIEVICCYVSHHPTVLSPLSRSQCDKQKLVYFLVNSSHLYVLSRKFISRITLTFRFNLMSHAEYIVLCGVSHLVIYFI